MEVSSQTNTNQYLQQLYKPNKDLYEASNANLINSRDGGVELTPQGETNLANKQEDKAQEVQVQAQATKDAQRGYATDYLGQKSKQSQVEIYLSVATDSDVDLNSGLSDSIKVLREAQQHDNVAQGYKQYVQNQQIIPFKS